MADFKWEEVRNVSWPYPHDTKESMTDQEKSHGQEHWEMNLSEIQRSPWAGKGTFNLKTQVQYIQQILNIGHLSTNKIIIFLQQIANVPRSWWPLILEQLNWYNLHSQWAVLSFSSILFTCQTAPFKQHLNSDQNAHGFYNWGNEKRKIPNVMDKEQIQPATYLNKWDKLGSKNMTLWAKASRVLWL